MSDAVAAPSAGAPSTATPVSPTESAASETTQVAPDYSELESKLESIDDGEAAQKLLAKLLKKHPIKAKRKGKEVAIDDLNKLQRNVGLGLHYDESASELRTQRESLEQERQFVQAFLSGDPDAVGNVLNARPEVLKAVAAQLQRQYEQEQQLQGLTPEMRQLALENQAMREQLLRAQREQQEFQKKQHLTKQQQEHQAARAELEKNLMGVLQAANVDKTLGAEGLRLAAIMYGDELLEGAPVEAVADKFSETLTTLAVTRAKAVPDDQLLSVFGEELGKRFAKAFLAKAQPERPILPNGAPRNPKEPQVGPDFWRKLPSGIR